MSNRIPVLRPSFISWALWLLLLLTARSGWAHESRPAYLQINETSPGSYNVLWRTPVLSGMRLPVALKFPDGVATSDEPVVQELNDSRLERRAIETGGAGLEGQRIEFIGLQATITDVLVRIQRLDGGTATVIVRPSRPWLDVPGAQSGWAVAWEYATLGVEHILLGIDHLLFVLALLLIASGTLQLIKTVTAFTVAHSITLGLATLGFIQVPQQPVEAVIALSIAFVAAAIIQSRRGIADVTARTPWIVAFVFGLLHGLGFAGALSDIGLPPGHIPQALLFFNLGVEAGQLLFIAAVTLFIALVRRMRVQLPGWAIDVPPYAIGSIAMFWVLQRIAAF